MKVLFEVTFALLSSAVRVTERERDSYPVFRNKSLSSSHLFMLKHPWENPNNPPAFFENGTHGCPKFGMPYTTWSCKEPPTLILRGLKAETK